MENSRLYGRAPRDNNPIQHFLEFMDQQTGYKNAEEFDRWRFVGYVLELGFSSATMITTDSFKAAVGGIPRNSLLIMVPRRYTEFPLHFILLRVLDTVPAPLSREVQQTCFEAKQGSMLKLDLFTHPELQWSALKGEVLGMFYPNPEDPGEIEFSSDINTFINAREYEVYAPTAEVLHVIINSMIPHEFCFPIGRLRFTECRLSIPGKPSPAVEARLSTADLMGTQTALFGKIGFGTSSTLLIIAQSLIETTLDTRNVGQIIFDTMGEYETADSQDRSASLKSLYEDQCEIYSFNPDPESDARSLKMNFYEQPDRSHQILDKLLEHENNQSNTINDFRTTQVPSLESLDEIAGIGDKYRAHRRILLYWAILKEAGFEADEEELKRKLWKITSKVSSSFDPYYRKDLRKAVYNSDSPPPINTLDDLVLEFKKILKYIKRAEDNDPLLCSKGSGDTLFDDGDRALLNFLRRNGGAGPRLIHPYRMYHDASAGTIFEKIIGEVDTGKTIILELGNADPRIITYYCEQLIEEILNHQREKFSTNNLGGHYIQLYFEEAHDLFRHNDDATTLYSRLVREGAHYHIGIVYSTQSPSMISQDLLAQTENFFIVHMPSRDEVRTLAKLNAAFENLQEDILRSKTPGYVRMLTRSHRFVVPIQIRKFSEIPERKVGICGPLG